MKGVLTQCACCVYNIFKCGSLAVWADSPDSHPRVPEQQQRSMQIGTEENI